MKKRGPRAGGREDGWPPRLGADELADPTDGSAREHGVRGCDRVAAFDDADLPAGRRGRAKRRVLRIETPSEIVNVAVP